jgi:small subunit ribosomal protein S4
MITGPKYKIARRLGAPIFEKTQTQKFKSRQGEEKPGARRKSITDYGRQMNEKQKARFTYGLSEKQFSNYVRTVIESKIANPHEKLFSLIESRLDNAVYRAGVASTRRFARQLVSHGHITVNSWKVTIPSYALSVGDVISIREGSLKKPVFSELDEKLKGQTTPSWLVGDKKTWKVQNAPKMEGEKLLFNLEEVLQFYKRS